MGKTVKIIAAIMIVLIAGFLIYHDFRKQQTLFHKRLSALEVELENQYLQGLINDFFFTNGELPDSISAITSAFTSEDSSFYISSFPRIIDPFTGKVYLYQKLDLSKYSIVSAGVDRKYNRDVYVTIDDFAFNYFDRYFGKEDLIVTAVDMISLLGEVSLELSFTELIEDVNSPLIRRYYSQPWIVKDFAPKMLDGIWFLEKDGTRAKIKKNGNENWNSLKEGDKLICFFDTYDDSDSTLVLRNCYRK